MTETLSRMVAGARVSRARAREVLLAVVFFGGLGLVVAGVWLVSVPAALIVGGVSLTLCAALYARGEARTPQ